MSKNFTSVKLDFPASLYRREIALRCELNSQQIFVEILDLLQISKENVY